MNNVKLTLATTLSVLALTFSGAVSADNGNRDKNYKQRDVISKTTFNKTTNRSIQKHKSSNANKNKTVVKRTVVRHTPNKRVTVAKTIVKKPSQNRYASNKYFKQVKRNKQQVKSNYRTNNNKRYNRVNTKRVAQRFAYSVRPGDTLIRISLKTGVSIQRLAKLNHLQHGNLAYLRVGQILRIA